MMAEWMHTLYGAIRAERVSPPVASRFMGYAAVALYSGLAAANSALPPLTGVLNGLSDLPQPDPGRRYDGTVAAINAERVVLDSLLRESLPTTKASIGRLVDSLGKARNARGIGDEVRAASEDLGRRIGLALVKWARADGFDGTRGRPYKPPVGEGFWFNDNPTNTYASQNLSGASTLVAPGNPSNAMRAGATSDRNLIIDRAKTSKTLPAVNMSGATEPYWYEVRPFVLDKWNACQIPAAPSYATDTASELYKNANKVYRVHEQLTPEQKTIALYWADNAGESGTPVGHWLAIAGQMVSEQHLSAEEAAKVMVMTAVAQADAFYAAWGYKYQYNLLRPRTYIRRVIDSTYEPFIPTPPFPEHPAGHATQSAAAASVMTALMGTVAFEDSSGLWIGHDIRKFSSFKAAADEAGISRIYAGIHFPSGNEAGRALGKCIGDQVVQRFKVSPRA
jgi:membrane-associated phospholipid phosphatase